jgi:hypothetical protein
MVKGMAEGGFSKPRGLGTDNMSCIIVEFQEGFADDAVLDTESKVTEENKTEYMSMIDIPKEEETKKEGEQFT